MSFDRTRLPDPAAYYEGEGLPLRGPRTAKWKTSSCKLHGGSDSLRVNVATGAFRCMNCGASGGDVLAYHMQAHGMEFVEAAKALGVWTDDGRAKAPQKPTTLPPRAALEVLAFEATLTALAAGNVAQGVLLTEADRKRLLVCAARINRIVGEYAA